MAVGTSSDRRRSSKASSQPPPSPIAPPPTISRAKRNAPDSHVTDVGYLAAFGGGLVSFASPCVLPVVPAYLCMVTRSDLSVTGGAQPRQLGRVALDTGLFVAGFGAVFVVLGLSATPLGRAALHDPLLLTRLLFVTM